MTALALTNKMPRESALISCTVKSLPSKLIERFVPVPEINTGPSEVIVPSVHCTVVVSHDATTRFAA